METEDQPTQNAKFSAHNGTFNETVNAMSVIRSWWTQSNKSTLLASQSKLLKALVPNYTMETLSDFGMNAVSFTTANDITNAPKETTCILAHGFGSGLGFFYKNVDPILNSGKYNRLILIDWLGMGGSERPSCRSTPYRSLSGWCDGQFSSPNEATHFFIDPLQGFIAKHVPQGKVHLVGHSLGGYLAGRYALTYPERLEKLVMASPVGIPNMPHNALPAAQLPTSLRLVDALWSSNLTPQALVRIQGANRGRSTVKRVLQARIGTLNPEHVALVAEYLYQITVARPSGEYAMNSLLSPVASPETLGVFAREPLEEGLKGLSPGITLRVSFGDHDWMRPNEPSARKVVDSLQAKGQDARVNIASNAGHHLYMDNTESFTRTILT